MFTELSFLSAAVFLVFLFLEYRSVWLKVLLAVASVANAVGFMSRQGYPISVFIFLCFTYTLGVSCFLFQGKFAKHLRVGAILFTVLGLIATLFPRLFQ